MTESTGGKTIDKEAFAQKVYACWLDTIYWISSQSKYRLLEAAEGIQEIYHMPEQQVQAVMGKRGCERFMQHRERFEPEAVWNYLARQGISYTYCQAADFPRRLTEIPDPPFGLFYKGRLPSDTMPAVAVIGARKCSERVLQKSKGD